MAIVLVCSSSVREVPLREKNDLFVVGEQRYTDMDFMPEYSQQPPCINRGGGAKERSGMLLKSLPLPP